MANKALKLRLKAEARELEHPTCQYPARTPARANAAAAAMAAHDNLLQVPPSKAILAGYPPQCPVLYIDTSVTPNISIKGIVEAVFIDLSPGSNREYFYQVGCGEEGNSFIARESHLQWVQNSPVWVRLQYENPDSGVKRACTIAGSYKQDMSTLYSVQEVSPGTCLFHGVTMDCIRFRLENDITGQHVEPSKSATAAATNAAATHHVACAIASTNASKAVPMPVMPVSSTPAVKMHDESVVARVTSSPRKRPNTEVAHHELLGCTAEFEVPRWMMALCLEDDFQHQICSFVQNCCDCRATILESLNRDSSDQSSTLVGHSIFIYGKDSAVVEQAIAAVSDLLQECVSKDEKKRLAAELQTGWKRNNDHDVDKNPAVFSEEEAKSSSYSNVPRATKSTDPKKARSPSEEGELRSAGSDSTTKVLFRSQTNACPPVQLASEKDMDTQSALSLQPVVAPSGQEELDTTLPAEEEDPDLVKRIIKVPLFANDSLIKEALVGPDDQIREYLFGETGCDLILKFPDGSLLDPIEVVLTGPFHDGNFDFAQRWVENRIVSTVAEDQKGRMLFSLAKENSYGASEGHARYQRSPYDLKNWVWMNVVEVPDGFQHCGGLFIDKKGKAIKDMIRSTKCSDIQLVDSLPQHIFLSSESLSAVEAATEAVKDRVLWALNEYKQRKYGSKKKKW